MNKQCKALAKMTQTGKTKTQLEAESRLTPPPYDYIVFAITMDREKLYERINRRVDIMIEQGLIEEVQSLVNKYKEFPTAMQGLGYKEVVEYIEGETTTEDMIEILKMETRKNKNIKWIDRFSTIRTKYTMYFGGIQWKIKKQIRRKKLKTK